MPVLDFKEIPEANLGGGKQDTFELFARDFLEALGYKIITPPDRGADGGRDLVVEEIRTGIAGQSHVKWLVSCKHKAYSGEAVSAAVETNIRDRVEANQCTGFIGLYSTLPSSGLVRNLEGLNGRIEIQVYDHERIERDLLSFSRGFEIAKRYFPVSISKWRSEETSPVQLYAEMPSLRCDYCSKKLLGDKSSGIIVI